MAWECLQFIELLFCAALAVLFVRPAAGADLSPLLNVAQFKGSHNSYERLEPIQDQLGFHQIRQLEFDLRYVNDDWVVYHDDGAADTLCYFLGGCLDEVKIWSNENPGHQPVFIWLDLKDQGWQTGGMESLDEIITAHLSEERLLTPDQLRQWYPDHQTAVGKSRWPALEVLRDHFIVVLTGNAAMNEAYAEDARPPLLGRPAFVSYEQTSPHWDFDDPLDRVSVPYHVIFNVNLAPPIPPWKWEFISRAHRRGYLTRAYNLAHNFSDWLALMRQGLNIFSSDWVNASKYPYAVVGDPLSCDPAGPLCDPSALSEPRRHILSATVKSGDIEWRTDSFYFAYNSEPAADQPLTFTVGVTHPNSFVEPSAKACLMARADLSASSPFFAVCRQGGKPPGVFYRLDSDTPSHKPRLHWEALVRPNGVRPENARFLKLWLSADRYTAAAYASYDRRNWLMLFQKAFNHPLVWVGPTISARDPQARFSAWFVHYARNEKPVTQFTGQSCIGPVCWEGKIKAMK